ncbi:MAG: DUF484 family protein [Rhodospirillales bacterium]
MTQKTDDPALDDRPEPDDGISGDNVAEYLRRNPDFFADRLELLSAMAAPQRWTGDGVVDMQRFLLERRLGEIEDLRNCAREVIETSRTNMSVQTRTHAAVLALLSVTEAEQLNRVVADDLPLLLDVDVVTLGFEPDGDAKAAPGGIDAARMGAGAIDKVLGAEENIRLVRAMKDDGAIFGSAAGLVRSAALARLKPGPLVPAGLLALGSRGSAFRPRQGTELIAFLARVFESCLHRLASD